MGVWTTQVETFPTLEPPNAAIERRTSEQEADQGEDPDGTGIEFGADGCRDDQG